MTLHPLVRPAITFGLLSALLGGCAEMHRGYESVAWVGSSPSVSVEEADAAPSPRSDVKTVRPHGASRSSASDVSVADSVERPTVVASAVPSPREIFDFHPAGSAPGSFRQPFIIDPNDGPLTADVRRSAKELKEFMAGLKTDTKTAERKRCGETDVATGKPGCVTPATKAATAGSRSTTMVQ